MLGHIEKLTYRISHMKKIEEGKNSDFWLTAGSIFKQITHDSNMSIAEFEGKLIICPSSSADTAESGNDKIAKLINRIKNSAIPSQLKDGMIQAIKQGKIPPDDMLRELGLNPDDYHDGNIREDEEE